MINYKSSKTFEILKKDIQNAMISHSYILHGKSEENIVGLSKNIAKHVLCKSENSTEKPCNKCTVCNNIENEIYSDVLMYPKNNKIINTANANDIVLQSYVKPLESDYKFFILNNFDSATIPAQNKLLKTIEEPNKNMVFIINTTNIFGVLDTIKSRSKIIYESKQDEVHNVLNAEKLQELTLNAMYNMKKSSEVLKTAYEIINQEKDLEKFVESLQTFLVDIVKLKNGISVDEFTNKNKEYAISELSEDLSFAGLAKIMKNSESFVNQLRSNCNKNLALETFLLKILEVKYKCKINAL